MTIDVTFIDFRVISHLFNLDLWGSKPIAVPRGNAWQGATLARCRARSAAGPAIEGSIDSREELGGDYYFAISGSNATI